MSTAGRPLRTCPGSRAPLSRAGDERAASPTTRSNRRLNSGQADTTPTPQATPTRLHAFRVRRTDGHGTRPTLGRRIPTGETNAPSDQRDPGQKATRTHHSQPTETPAPTKTRPPGPPAPRPATSGSAARTVRAAVRGTTPSRRHCRIQQRFADCTSSLGSQPAFRGGRRLRTGKPDRREAGRRCGRSVGRR